MDEPKITGNVPPPSITLKEYHDVQVTAFKQNLYVMDTMMQKVNRLEKAIEELSK